MTLLLHPPNESKTGQTSNIFPEVIIFYFIIYTYFIPSEELKAACAPDAICASGSKDGVPVSSPSTSLGSGPQNLPWIFETQQNQIHRGGSTVRTKPEHQKFPWIQRGIGKAYGRKIHQELDQAHTSSGTGRSWATQQHRPEKNSGEISLVVFSCFSLPKYSSLVILGHMILDKMDAKSDTDLMQQDYLRSLQLISFSLFTRFFNIHSFLHIMENVHTRWNTVITLMECRNRKEYNGQVNFSGKQNILILDQKSLT